MRKITIPFGRKAAIAVVALFLAAAFVLPALGQEDIVSLADPAFGTLRRPASQFNHAKHTDDFGIGCEYCHHQGMENGEFIPSDDPGADKCADCHAVNPESGTSLRNAYHKLCENCHEREKKGPIMCGECHKR